MKEILVKEGVRKKIKAQLGVSYPTIKLALLGIPAREMEKRNAIRELAIKLGGVTLKKQDSLTHIYKKAVGWEGISKRCIMISAVKLYNTGLTEISKSGSYRTKVRYFTIQHTGSNPVLQAKCNLLRNKQNTKKLKA